MKQENVLYLKKFSCTTNALSTAAGMQSGPEAMPVFISLTAALLISFIVKCVRGKSRTFCRNQSLFVFVGGRFLASFIGSSTVLLKDFDFALFFLTFLLVCSLGFSILCLNFLVSSVTSLLLHCILFLLAIRRSFFACASSCVHQNGGYLPFDLYFHLREHSLRTRLSFSRDCLKRLIDVALPEISSYDFFGLSIPLFGFQLFW